MPNIEINKEKCVKCGACIRDCITYSIEMGEDGYPKVTDIGESNCISCQHCFAICPQGAITFDGKNPDNVSMVKYANAEELLEHIKSRRSVRQFKRNDVSQEDLSKIKSMLPYVPTGCNYNSLHFSFIESGTAMDVIREYVNRKVLKLISNKFTQKYAGKFVKFKSAFENGEDIIFRNAPHMVVVSSHIHAPCANVDPIIALSYFELYAQSLGIGTCWCGFAQACFKLLPKLSKMVNIPDGYKPAYVMLFGYPAVNYKRTVEPNKFPISEIKVVDDIKINWTERLRRILLNFIR